MQEALALRYEWSFWARPEQLAPEGDWFTWLIRSGRGFGKTRTGAEWVRQRVDSGHKRIALIGQTKADVRDTMIEVGESGLLNICPPWNKPLYEPSKRRMVWPNGAMAIVYSGDEPDQLRGPQHDSVWVDEFAKFKYPQETWDNLKLGLRIGSDPRCAITTTPKPIKVLKDIISQASTRQIIRPSYDNIANLSPVYIREVIKPMEGTRLGRQEIHAELLEDVEGALWHRDQLDALRVTKAPPLVRIVVAIDPSTTSKDESDEAGIVVAGVDDNGHGYVLEDCTLRGSPNEWATEAVAAYHRFFANMIVAESNQGGDMVALTIGTIENAPPVSLIHAKLGKRARAEPIAGLCGDPDRPNTWSAGRVHHVGFFPDLEDELCGWDPKSSVSPNRLDAMVYALSELMLTGGESYSEANYPDVNQYRFSNTDY